ncbi:hypothetical protein DY000_02031512 [Brassica cretica]|uniref:Uncharacterized protein n=1 Tax=Brassica cretica TaxID=69181 RepID=A0ABQ7E0H4_BRACR|nr:hypothetical protein DY000_02031512 [Brassica cretica]
MIDRGLDKYSQVLDLFEGDLVGFGAWILYLGGRQDLRSGPVDLSLGTWRFLGSSALAQEDL